MYCSLIWLWIICYRYFCFFTGMIFFLPCVRTPIIVSGFTVSDTYIGWFKKKKWYRLLDWQRSYSTEIILVWTKKVRTMYDSLNEDIIFFFFFYKLHANVECVGCFFLYIYILLPTAYRLGGGAPMNKKS